MTTEDFINDLRTTLNAHAACLPWDVTATADALVIVARHDALRLELHQSGGLASLAYWHEDRGLIHGESRPEPVWGPDVAFPIDQMGPSRVAHLMMACIHASQVCANQDRAVALIRQLVNAYTERVTR